MPSPVTSRYALVHSPGSTTPSTFSRNESRAAALFISWVTRMSGSSPAITVRALAWRYSTEPSPPT
jgi:hypothetical protein